MRRINQEITDRSIIEEILSTSQVCRLGMVENNVAYIVPLNYGYRQNTLYFHSAGEGKKLNILRRESTVCFEIEGTIQIAEKDIPCEWSTEYRSLIGYGSVEIITDNEQKKRGLDIIMAQHGSTGDHVYKENQVENMVILKLTINHVTGKQSGNWNEQAARRSPQVKDEF